MSKHVDTEIPEQRCWKCGYLMDQTTEAYGDHRPRVGDVSMCLGCGAISLFAEGLMLRKPTPEEQVRLEADPRITHAQITRAHVIGDHKLGGYK